ncbi:MAG: hypothetical protein O2968_03360 [Acidobacteria bacterium]|nr:hypothetical protein [Acidobacteriota bacterium]
MAIVPTGGYREKVGESSEGYTIYLYDDARSGVLRYVVVLPNGRAAFSDSHGRVGYPVNTGYMGAMLGGIGGLLVGGPVGGIVGAVLGAVVGGEVRSKQAA